MERKAVGAISVFISLIILAVPVSAVEIGTSEGGELTQLWNFTFVEADYWLDDVDPAIGDLMGDSNLEVAIGSGEDGRNMFPGYPGNTGRYLVLDADGTWLWDGYTHDDWAQAPPAIADINEDGVNDLIGGSCSGQWTLAFSGDGSDLWRFGRAGEFNAGPIVVDVAPDAGKEVFMVDERGRIFLLNSTGQPVWWHGCYRDDNTGQNLCSGLPDGYFDDFIATPAAGDVDNDGALEAIVVDWDGFMASLDLATGTVEWTTTLPQPDWVYSSPALADLDGDGFLEIIIGSGWDEGYGHYGEFGTLFVLDARNGQVKWTYPIGLPIISAPAVGDVDNDGGLEIIFGSHDGNIYCLDSSGNLEWQYTTGGPVHGSASLADRTNTDPYNLQWPMYKNNLLRTGYYGPTSTPLDIFIGSDDGYLYVLSGTGQLIERFYTADPVWVSPAIGDLKGEGYQEMLFKDLEYKFYAIGWTDSDGDIVPDYLDNCPYMANPDQADTKPSGGDGIGDACQQDYDGDTINDNNDNCPNIYNPLQENLDNDTKGDVCDLCPDDPGDACASTVETVNASEGGTVENPVGTATVDIVPDALPADTNISIIGNTSTSNFAVGKDATNLIVGYVYTFKPEGLTFNTPVNITLFYEQGSMREGRGAEKAMDIYYYNTAIDPATGLEYGWEPQGASQDMTNFTKDGIEYGGTLTLHVTHFSTYAVIATRTPATVEIKPETLNIDAGGVFEASVALSEEYSASDVVPESVECNGAPAIRTSTKNNVLSAKFNIEDLVDVPTGDAVELTVTGKLTDDSRFKSSDTVKVVSKRKVGTVHDGDDSCVGAVAYWNFDEGSGAAATDSVGTNDGTINGDATWTDGIVGGALNFGEDVGYVEVPSSPELKLVDGFTISAWVYPTYMKNCGWSTILLKDDYVWDYSMSLWHKCRDSGKPLNIDMWFDDLTPDEVYAGDVPLNKWTHVSGTYDGATGKTVIYQNGEEVGNRIHSGTITHTDGPLTISEPHIYDSFKGKIDEVAIFDHALSAEEIEAQYLAGLAGGSYCKFDVNRGHGQDPRGVDQDNPGKKSEQKRTERGR